MNTISLKISGDYVDSYIYSGLLFLVKNGGEIIQVNWNSLLDRKIRERGCIEFMKNCQNKIENDFEDFAIFLDERDISDFILDRENLEFWPNDFIIYSNVLYFSGQSGVEAIGLDFRNKKFTKENRKFIFNHRSYKLASARNRGVAIAAGSNGVVLKSISKSLDDLVAPKVIEENSIDVEWGGTSLVVNSDSRSKIDFFKKMPDVDFREMSFSEKNEFHKSKVKNIFEKTMPGYSWSIGNRLFNLNNNQLVRSVISVEGDEEADVEIKSVEIKSENQNFDNLDSARSASFGCIIDLYSKIFLLNDAGMEEIGQDLTKWKVFPRAKNYVNHLHMIENDSLHIKIFARKEMISRRFGISPSKIDA